MLPQNLTTNEVKIAAGTEIEFLHLQQVGRKKEYQQSAEPYARPHRIVVQHEETGEGVNRQRRSNVNVVKNVISDVDNLTIVPIRVSMTLQVPIGRLVATTEVKNVVAEIISFVASQGATTTILYDCTGYGATSLVDGSL
jgi:hypothetical protein